MKHTQEEIINALKVIQDVCKEAPDSHPCEHCPLSKNGYCVLQEKSPESWKLRTNPPVWTAFE